MKISIIVAMSENGVIGSSGKIPWHLPADFKKFKDLTMGHPIIMGRKTFASIGKSLPGRTNIVITRDLKYTAEGCAVVHSFEEALLVASKSAGGEEIFAIGGEQIYRRALPKAETIYLTKVRGAFEGDVFFPKFNESEWQLVSEEAHQKDEKNPVDYSFLVYQRERRDTSPDRVA